LLGRDKKRELKEAGYSIALTNPIDFVLRQTPGHTIHRYIQTHPDLDHMRGLAALREHRVDIANFWDTQHDKVPDFRSNSDRDHVEWAEYQRLRSGRAGARCLTLHAGAVGQFWNRDPSGGGDHDGIEILTPTPEIVRRANGEENSNNLSYVLRLTYAGRSIILGGDAEEEVWRYLAQRHGARLKCDVLKASHHGRDSGYCADAVKLLSPTYTIVSVGKKPETDASNKYRAYSQRVWSTRWYGNLTLQVDAWGEIRWKAYPFEHGGTRC
jgi:beta-lactamase superfamily II metal-dependent hydrolase